MFKNFALKTILLTLSLGVFAGPRYSITVSQRPFTMPKNSFETSFGFSNKSFALLNSVYGITDNFQLGLEWGGLDTSNFPDQKVSLGAQHFLFSTPYLSAKAVMKMPFNFNRMVLQEIALGMPAYVPLVRDKLTLVFLENLVTVNWLEDTKADFQFSTRLSWQATQAIWLYLSTSLGTLSTLGNHNHIVQTTPLTLFMLYAVTPMVDITAETGFRDIQNQTGFTVMLGVSIRGGNIEG